MKNDKLEDACEAMDLAIATYQKAYRTFLKESGGDISIAIEMANGFFHGIMSSANNKDSNDLGGLL